MTTTGRQWTPLLLAAALAGPSLMALNTPVAFGETPTPSTTSLKLTATVNPNPPRVGDNALDVSLVDASGKPVGGMKMTTRVEMTSMDMGTAHPAVQDVGGGRYRVPVNFSMAGSWKVTLRGGSDKAVLLFNVGRKSVWKSPPLLLTTADAGTAQPPMAASGSPDSAPAMDMTMPSPDKSGMAGGGMAGMDMSKGGSRLNADMTPLKMPQLQEQGTYVATGNEDWKVRTGFGRNAGMVGMMSQMMVGGSGMEGMKMAPMKMEFGKPNYTEDQGEEGSTASPAAATMKGMPTDGGAMPGMPMGDAKASGEAGATPTTPLGNTETTGSLHTPDASEMSGMNIPGMSTPTVLPSDTPSGKTTPFVIKGAIASPKSGDNTLTVTVTTAAGTSVVGAEVTSTVAMTSMDMGTTHPPIKEAGKGEYRGTVGFSMAGPWRVTVNVTPPSGGQTQKATFDFNAK